MIRLLLTLLLLSACLSDWERERVPRRAAECEAACAPLTWSVEVQSGDCHCHGPVRCLAADGGSL
jgi:hypothetical protein